MNITKALEQQFALLVQYMTWVMIVQDNKM